MGRLRAVVVVVVVAVALTAAASGIGVGAAAAAEFTGSADALATNFTGSADAPATNFTVSADVPAQVTPGKTIGVTFTVENTGDAALESLGLGPSSATRANTTGGLRVTNASSAAAVAVTDDERVLFETVAPGEVVTATLTVEVEANASGNQTLSVRIVNGFGANETARIATAGFVVREETPGGPQVDSPAAVRAGGEATITVASEQTGKLAVAGETRNWTVTATDPAGLTTAPNPSQTPYETAAGEAWGHVFSSVTAHEFQVTVTAPNETGRYTFTAESTLNGTTATTSFTVAVRERTRHPSGVSRALFEAVAGADGTLERADVIAAVSAYASGRPVDGVPIARSDVLALVTYYVRQS